MVIECSAAETAHIHWNGERLTMNTRTPNQVLDEIARDQIGHEINLFSDINVLIRKDNKKHMKSKVFLTGVAALIMVLVVLFSIPSVAKAIGHLFGYIPETGFVEQSSTIRLLREPVEIKSGEIVIAVSQAVVDANHTTLIYQIDNIPDAETANLGFEDYCHALPSLQLADGSKLVAKTITGNFWGSGHSRQLEFDSLPQKENSVKLVFSCIEQAPIAADIPQIELLLNFIEAPADMTVYPIVDLPTPTIQTSETSLPEENDSPSSQISLILNKYVQTDEQLILMAALESNNTNFRLSLVEQKDVHLIDVDGREIAINENNSVTDPGIERTNMVLPLTYITGERYTPGLGTLMINRLWIENSSDESFTFDPGLNPQPGQIWTINQTLKVDGYNILIKEIIKNTRDEGLTVTYETPEDISNISLMDLENPQLGGGGGEDSTGFTYINGFPTGKITITLTSYSARILGPWQVQVELPAFSDGGLPTDLPEACLTKTTWDAALLSGYSELPETLEGMLILADTPAPDYTYHVLSADLWGDETTNLDLGDGGSLSPDRQTVVYATQEGLKLLTLATGDVNSIPDTTRRDRDPVWSPDGTKIAFTRGQSSGLIGGAGLSDLMLMDADGSHQTVLLSDGEANHAQDWMPFSKVVLYTVKGPDGATLKYINSETGEVNLLTNLNYQEAGVSISPTGRQIAYEALLPGHKYAIYVSSLDGSNARLIANTDPIVVTHAQWSPDGEWLAVSMQDTSVNEYSSTIALVNPDSCQVIPISNLKGYVTSWR